jgi:replicative DNA helicase Mcm
MHREEDIAEGIKKFLYGHYERKQGSRKGTHIKGIWHDKTAHFLQNYPESTSLIIDYVTLENHLEANIGHGVGIWIADNPKEFLKIAETAVRELASNEFLAFAPEKDMRNPENVIHIRLRGYPERNRIRDITQDQICKMVSIEGIVRRATSVKPKLMEAVFQCMRCEHLNYVPQPDQKMVEPGECEDESCGKRGPFKMLYDKSTYTDFQLLEIQESPDSLTGQQPRNIVIRVYDDLCDANVPTGEQIVVTGILEIENERSNRDGKSTTYNYVIDAINIEVDDNSYESLEISDEEYEEIMRLSAREDLKEQIVGSIAPSVYGYDNIKMAMALQLFSGVSQSNTDGTKLRGDIHILTVGDPGVAKSQMVRNLAEISPRGVYASGKSTSGVGLTAAAVKDGLDSDRWTVEGGAMVLADGGVCAVDELDKMNDEDRSALHEAMEQQTLHIHKAGINTSLRTRCALLGAANPKFGRFDPNEAISDQINMQPALISRFDLIFIMQDTPDAEKDEAVCDHILRMHTSEFEEISKPAISVELLRKYVAYSKSNVHPDMTDEPRQLIKNYYLGIRGRGKDTVSLNARYLEGLVRMAQASARMRLSNYVEVCDAQVAIDLLDGCMRNLGVIQDNGGYGIDYIEAGISSQDRNYIHTIHEYIVDMKTPVNAMDIAQGTGIAQDTVEKVLYKMAMSGDIMRQSGGYYSAVN